MAIAVEPTELAKVAQNLPQLRSEAIDLSGVQK
jgi:hypothetical protein